MLVTPFLHLRQLFLVRKEGWRHQVKYSQEAAPGALLDLSEMASGHSDVPCGATRRDGCIVAT